jgi:hypothetical protein
MNEFGGKEEAIFCDFATSNWKVSIGFVDSISCFARVFFFLGQNGRAYGGKRRAYRSRQFAKAPKPFDSEFASYSKLPPKVVAAKMGFVVTTFISLLSDR